MSQGPRNPGLGFGVLVALALTTVVSCEPPTSSDFSVSPSSSGDGRSLPPAAGSTCQSRDDCPSEQVCVRSTCRHRDTSQAGEVLAVGASKQMEAGDYLGALATFGEAIEEFEAVSAPLSPEVACGAALAALKGANEEDRRERAAREAYRCFRNSLSGDPMRVEVQIALARLRFDGLDLRLFDASEVPPSFFTQAPSRPTADAIQIQLDLPDSGAPGFSQLRDKLLQEDAQRATSDCFVQDWERRHQRSVEAPLVLRFTNRLRDMGDYDLYVPEVEVSHTGTNPDSFSVCVSRALTDALSPGPRVGRSVSAWQEAFTVGASVQ